MGITVAPPSVFADPSSWAGGARLLLGADAVLLAIDGGEPFDDGARGCLGGWSACAAAAGASTLLLVSTGSSAGFASGHAAAALDWALDNGFEHVCADPARPAEGGEGRDKWGVPRVLEALESTVWRNAVKTGRAPGGGGAREAAEEEEEAAAASNAGGGGGARAQPYEPPAFSEGGGRCGAAAAGAGIAPAVSTASAPTAQAALPAEPRAKREDEFEEVLSLARATRDAARSGNLSDEQRREAAMSAAMRLMSLLGEEDDGEEGGGGAENKQN